MKLARPRTIEVGKAYRIRHPFGAGSYVVLVSEVIQITKATRTIWYSTVEEGDDRHLDNYSSFLRRVLSEEKTAIN